MKKYFLYTVFICISLFYTIYATFSWPGYRLKYKEQLYELYHRHLTMYPEKFAENIYWLEQVLRSDFANPFNALAKISTKKEWEWYRNHFNLHINLLLTKLYLGWGKKYGREKVYFYNAPWKEENIASLQKAITLFEHAIIYWQKSLQYVKSIDDMNEFFMSLDAIHYWEDEYIRIKLQKLDYTVIIQRELQKAKNAIAEFEAMNETTY